ncbi:MAG: hypothetical protein IJC26_00755 [Clostridia bacterium]|nr:hypothetical protein [Clostridia bacterium]
MKRSICILLLFCIAFSFCSCAKEEASPAQTGDVFSPLFRFTVSEGKSGETRLFYLPESDGFLYLHPGEEGGITGGFVSPERSISSEALFKSEASLSEILVWEDARDRAHVLTEDELFTVLLKENGAHRTPLPEDLSLKHPTPLNTLSFINEKDSLLLIHPVDFKETYVLADSSRLPDFATLLLPAENEKKLWYARSDGAGAYKGIGFFEYGSNLPLGNEDFPFDSFQPIGSSSVLFTRILEDGGALYLYRDLESGETRSLVADTVFQGVTCDPKGITLCGTTVSGEGGKIHVFDLKKGTQKGEYAIDYGAPAPSLAITSDASSLLIAVGKGSDEILGTLDLTKF